MSNLGLRNNVRSPGSIDNAEHNDPSGSKKTSAGSAASIKSIVPDSTVKTVVGDFAELRVCNTTASVKFLYIGDDSACPVGAPTITTGLALAPNSVEILHGGQASDGTKSIVIKSDSSGVQVTSMNS